MSEHNALQDMVDEVPNPNKRFKHKITEVNAIVNHKENCGTSCRYYSICPMRDLSTQTDGTCLLRGFPYSFRTSFMNLFIEGKTGLVYEIMLTLFRYRQVANIDGSKADAKEYHELLLKTHREIYGGAKSQPTPKDLEVEIRQMGTIDGKRFRRLEMNDELIEVAEDLIGDPEDKESLFYEEMSDDVRAILGKDLDNEEEE